MFRFAEAPVLHDETSWSASGTRRRRLARPPSAPTKSACRRAHLNTVSCSPQPSTDAPRELRQLDATAPKPRGEN